MAGEGTKVNQKEHGTPILGFAAYSGTGKTTLIEKIVAILTERGLNVAVVKHDAHGLKFDHEGKDSARFSKAGARYSIVSSKENAAIFLARPLEPEEACAFAKDADIILVEGYKNANFSQIGLNRAATGKGFTDDLRRFVALVTDVPVEDAGRPVFALDEYEKIADFIIENMDGFTRS